ncbi:MAG: multiheme c-type cytochrome, partial [bacterium]
MKVPTFLKILRNFCFALLFGFIFTLLGCNKQEPDRRKTSEAAIQPLTKHWERPIPFQPPPEGLSSLSAEECGECHVEIYREWKTSFHAQAWHDPQFQAEWAKDDSLWVCINCHTPLQNQQVFTILGKKGGDYFQPVKEANPYFDPTLQKEAITCAVCHVRNQTVIGP